MTSYTSQVGPDGYRIQFETDCKEHYNCVQTAIRYCIDIDAIRDKQEHFRENTKKVEPMTNADKIRAMSDEELAECISSIPMCVGKDEDKNCEKDGCKDCFFKWRQQTAQEGTR